MQKLPNEAQGLDLRTIGSVGWVPFHSFSQIWEALGWPLSSRWVRRGGDPVEARLKVMLNCAGVSVFAFTIHFVHSTAVVVGLMSLATLVS